MAVRDIVQAAAGVGGAKNYIEDVFSTYLYTGNGSTQTITNGIDLAGEGGLVWCKDRTIGLNHALFDTARGVINMLQTDNTSAQSAQTGSVTAFNTNGFTVNNNVYVNNTTTPYASWTFRKQPKFMTIATWTGNGAASQVINHDLGSVPGFIIVKAYSGASASSGWWYCYHRSLGNTKAIALNSTDAATTLINFWRNTDPTSTQFTVGSVLNGPSTNFVAYVFAHDAGGFGESGKDNVISCGSYVGTGGTLGSKITLGWEPQWILMRESSIAESWRIHDVTRGLPTGANSRPLFPNLTNAEPDANYGVELHADGMTPWGAQNNQSGVTYIYIAIRRGPMKVPESGTEVFAVDIDRTAGLPNHYSGWPVDMFIGGSRGVSTKPWFDRLRGVYNINSASTAAEAATSVTYITFDQMTGIGGYTSDSSGDIRWMFRRAPGFFDVVCYTGTNSVSTDYAHNLTVQPELILVKRRNSTGNWAVVCKLNSTQWITSGTTGGFVVNSTSSTLITSTYSNLFTSTTAKLGVVGGGYELTHLSAGTYVAYLFATLPGVSKVFNYTGNGSSQTINCGFTGGARFVMIKRTDSTGDWYVWDSARGIVSGNDPHLSLNTTAAEVTTDDSVDTDSTGFVVNQVAATNVNVNAATYIGIAIA